MSIPDALIDSARIDGASEIRILFRIILPMVPAVIIVSGIISFLGSWNNFLWPLLAVRSVDMWTYPIALANLATTTTIMYGDIFALTTIYLVPLVIVFALLQEQFVRGFTVTGMKG
jgi:multiple sugar transport system permease protein